MSKAGTYVVVFMLLAAVIATVGNIWYQQHRGSRPLELWGVEPARLIGLAPKIEVLRLAPAEGGEADSNVAVKFRGTRLRIVAAQDATESRGVKNIRQGLLDSASFKWDSAAQDCDPQWDYALRFTEKQLTATILFAINCQRVALAGGNAEASMAPTFAAYEAFLREQFPASK